MCQHHPHFTRGGGGLIGEKNWNTANTSVKYLKGKRKVSYGNVKKVCIK